ncbi:MAG: hypothetical protein KAU38_02465 [Desulfobacterales bacterium]|nr:hypothetical protein [Desulfobacterales bacterium]
MGIGLRIFLVNDDDSLERLAVARYDRLLRRDPEECLPQYAGKRVRYALVAYEVENRIPVEILKIEYNYLFLDSEGRIDAGEAEKERRLAVDLFPPMLPEEQAGQVIDAKHRFARKRYDAKYRWTPSRELEAAILNAVFGKNGFF